MRTFFVTYGNSVYRQSLKRICEEAKESGEFDEVLAFTDTDLPDYITLNELFAYSRGGGIGYGNLTFA